MTLKFYIRPYTRTCAKYNSDSLCLDQCKMQNKVNPSFTLTKVTKNISCISEFKNCHANNITEKNIKS